jgi:hypothetical protein
LTFGALAASAQQAIPNTLVFNLTDPSKIAVLAGGSFLVAQPGARPNFSKVTFFDQFGDNAPLLLGLPFLAQRPPTTTPTPSGPDGLAVYGNTLFIATAQIVAQGDNPPSPDLGAILRATFSRDLASLPGPFFLQSNDI